MECDSEIESYKRPEMHTQVLAKLSGYFVLSQ